MIQGGDPNTKSGDPSLWGTGNAGSNVKAEFSSVKHKRGIVSMARSGHPDSAATSADETTTSVAAETTSSAAPAQQEKPMSAYENKVAEIHTSAGEIDIRFFPDVAPNHVKNFITLAEQGFYNGTKFHRVIP